LALAEKAFLRRKSPRLEVKMPIQLPSTVPMEKSYSIVAPQTDGNSIKTPQMGEKGLQTRW